MKPLVVVRQSAISTYRDCPRSWYLQYVRSGLGLEKIEEDVSKNADIGTKVHKRLEAHYKDQPEPVFEPGDETLLSKLMVDGYIQWVADTGADFGERQEFIERRIALPIPNVWGRDVEVSCQLDRLVFDEITEEYIVDDFKTVASLGVSMLEVNQQLLTYVLAVEASGFPCRRGRITQLKRSKRTAKATPPFYERFELYVTDEMKKNHLLHLRATLGKMVRDLDLLSTGAGHQEIMYPVPSRDCSWRCPFVSVCPSMDDGSDWENELSENFKPRTEHF